MSPINPIFLILIGFGVSASAHAYEDAETSSKNIVKAYDLLAHSVFTHPPTPGGPRDAFDKLGRLRAGIGYSRTSLRNENADEIIREYFELVDDLKINQRSILRDRYFQIAKVSNARISLDGVFYPIELSSLYSTEERGEGAFRREYRPSIVSRLCSYFFPNQTGHLAVDYRIVIAKEPVRAIFLDSSGALRLVSSKRLVSSVTCKQRKRGDGPVVTE